MIYVTKKPLNRFVTNRYSKVSDLRQDGINGLAYENPSVQLEDSFHNFIRGNILIEMGLACPKTTHFAQ